MNLNFNVIGLGHPTKWHVSINNEFETKEEAEQLKARLESLIDNTCIIPAEEFDRKPTKEEIESAKEAEKYYLEHSEEGRDKQIVKAVKSWYSTGASEVHIPRDALRELLRIEK